MLNNTETQQFQLVHQQIAIHGKKDTVGFVIGSGPLLNVKFLIIKAIYVDQIVHRTLIWSPGYADKKVACALGMYEILDEASSRLCTYG
jgi:hypothetical protein